MAKPTTPARRLLVTGLKRMKTLQDRGRRAFRATDFSRYQLPALTAAGFLQPVVKGWYIASRPGEEAGDTTAWFASMRDFVGNYCDQRFRARWHLAPDLSLLVQAGATTLPAQIVVHAERGTNYVLNLPGGSSLLDYKAPTRMTPDQTERVGPLRVLTIEHALVRVAERFFQTFPTDAQVVLSQLRDVAGLNRILVDEGRPVVAGRLAGALRAAHRAKLADEMLATMRSAGYTVQETDPFTRPLPTLGSHRATSPAVSRLRLMWQTMREPIAAHFATPPGRPRNSRRYLTAAEEAYKADAYHSLSIEGYQVTEQLIERVTSGKWAPDTNADDATTRDALAARGYFLARREVMGSLKAILGGANAGMIVDRDHGTWYRKLFEPGVTAGILEVRDLAGYRTSPVYIRNALHVPPSSDAAREMMPVLFELLTEESSPAVRAVLGHFFFVFIHPYMDGNGRMARFLMNAMFASGGYPWTIIPVNRRKEYMASLDTASAGGKIEPFARFVASCVGTPPPPIR
ncbi:MAG TPA: Fic family protein [Gemmatimonadaceae bacterium]